MPDDTGLTLRDLVLEVRQDVKEMKEDLGSRVAVLEHDAVKTKAVANALVVDKKARWTAKEKLVGVGFALVTVVMNLLALGPDIFNF